MLQKDYYISQLQTRNSILAGNIIFLLILQYMYAQSPHAGTINNERGAFNYIIANN